jgi:LuxR family transcriptional regulator, maltose regulon positive regulatory protein
MSSSQDESQRVPGQCLAEHELAASSLTLLAQPALWPSLRLAPAAATTPRNQPWTTYWSTRLDATLPVEQARYRFEAALAAFGARQDRSGELLCIAAIIEGFYVEEGPLDPLDRWIAALSERLPADGQWPSDAFEASIMACGVGIRLRSPSHPLLAAWAARGASLMRRLEPGAGRQRLATFLAQYHLWRGELGRTGLIVDAMPGLALQGLLPGEALMWLDALANYARNTAQHQRARDAIDAALTLVRQHGLRQREYALHAYGATVALAAQDLARAQTHVDAMRPVLDSGKQADQTHYWHYLAGLTLLRGDAVHAVEFARTALENSGEIGGPTRLATHSLSLGQALLRAGDDASALECFDSALDAARRMDAAQLTFTARLMRSVCLLHLGRMADATQALREAWSEGAKRDFRITAVWWLPDVVGEVAQAALERDIETAYVRRFVRLHGLAGTDPALADWPWPLVLRSFGEFKVRLDDEPLTRTGGKTAQRPLDLLRAMLAHGTSPLPVATAMHWLWPDADPPAQRKAFDAALLRLRRTLADPRLLRLEGGHLSLDERWCWSDVAALQQLLHRIGSAHGAALERLQDWARRLMDLMRGPFLAAEDADWAAAARARYSQRFVMSASQLAAHIEPLDSLAAIRLYERALDVEPLAESLSRRLIRLHADRGERAESLRAWRSCCTMLRAAGGLGPSLETRALAAQLGLPDLGVESRRVGGSDGPIR